MNNSRVGEFSQIRQSSWLQTTLISLRTNVTTSNIIGLVGAISALFLLLALPEPWNMRLPLYLTITVWTIVRPRVALYLMPLAVPWGSLDTFNLAGLNVNSADILVALLAAGWLMSLVLHFPCADETPGGPRDYGSTNVPRYLVVALLALLGTMIFSMVVAISISSSLKEISKWVEFLVLLLLGSQYIRTRRQVWTLVVLICIGGITQALFGYVQAFFNIGPDTFIRDASLRVYGTFGQPNPYAGYINIPLSIALALMVLGGNWATRIRAGITVLILAGAEYLTQSRGGEIAIAVVVLFLFLAAIPRSRILLGLLALAGLGIIALFLAGLLPEHFLTPILQKLGLTQISLTAPSPQDTSTAERLAHWIAGLRMFVAHPIIGTGIGNYPDAYPQYFIAIWTNPLGHAHNYYINIAAETGLIGLIAFLLFLFATFLVGGRAYQRIRQKYIEAQAESRQQEVWHRPLFSMEGFLRTAWGRVGAGVERSVEGTLVVARGGDIAPLKGGAHLAHARLVRIQSLVRITNDRALAIGLLAALISVCVHNLVDDLYVHSMTNLIALLLVALIRLSEVTSKAGGNGG